MTAARRISVSVLGLACLMLASAAGTWALTTTSAPSSMVGSWKRYVGAAAYKRFSAKVDQTGTWGLAVTRSGRVTISAPRGGKRLKGTLKATGAKVSFSVGCKTSNVYRWSAVPRLTFKYVADKKCPARAAVLTGTWKKR